MKLSETNNKKYNVDSMAIINKVRINSTSVTYFAPVIKIIEIIGCYRICNNSNEVTTDPVKPKDESDIWG